jgi:hypothetical protein
VFYEEVKSIDAIQQSRCGAIGSQPIRTHIRATLEALDIAYLHHGSIRLGTTDRIEASSI